MNRWVAGILRVGAPFLGSTPGTVPYNNGGKIGELTTSGSGTELALTTGASLTGPSLGVATATSINKVAITAPAASATLTIANGKTFTASNTIALTATDGSTLAIGAGGTLGTAAYQSTGTSGTTIPFLDGTNTWAAAQTMSTTLAVGGGVFQAGDVNTLVAGVGVRATRSGGAPSFTTERTDVIAGGDQVAGFASVGLNSTSMRKTFSNISMYANAITNGAEVGEIRLRNMVAGTLTDVVSVIGINAQPSANNATNLGAASFAWKDGWIVNAWTVTSGRRFKTAVRGPRSAEKRAAVRIKAMVKLFKSAAAVAEKGEAAARWHVGYVAEDVRDCLLAEGLDPGAYGLFMSSPEIVKETYTVTSLRPKTQTVIQSEAVIEMRDGKAVKVSRDVERVELVGEIVAVVDEDDRPVMVESGRDEDDNAILALAMHFVPEMEEYEEVRTRDVESGEQNLALRYSELEAFLRLADDAVIAAD